MRLPSFQEIGSKTAKHCTAPQPVLMRYKQREIERNPIEGFWCVMKDRISAGRCFPDRQQLYQRTRRGPHGASRATNLCISPVAYSASYFTGAALTLPQVRYGLSLLLLEVFCTPGLDYICRQIHRQLMRNELARFYHYRTRKCLPPRKLRRGIQ
jgi:hypothetical protein